MDIDTSTVDRAREHAEQLEAQASDARDAYYRAVSDLVKAHGATATARALGITRARVYQLTGKLDDART